MDSDGKLRVPSWVVQVNLHLGIGFSLGCRIWGLGSRAEGVGLRVQGSDLGCRA